MENIEIKNPTEGEEYVMDFLRELGIKYEREKKLVGLKGDSKQYRVADFYLPKYNAYIEFFGLWNKNIKDDDYKAKKDIYRNNGIPCVYIYPENLGILHFFFDKRLQKQLIENGKYKELRKYHWFKFFKARLSKIIFAFICFVSLIIAIFFYKPLSDKIFIILLLSVVLAYQLFLIITAYVNIFVKNKFSLLKLLE